MPRRARSRPALPRPTPSTASQLVTQVINKVMLDGKKSIAEQIVYDALEQVGTKTGRPPVEVLEQAVKTVTPVLEVRAAASAARTTRFRSRCRSAGPARSPCAGS